MDPLVSVIIPCYNRAPTIKLCLRSVAAQTYPHIEVIVVDDGSVDDSAALAAAAGASVVRLPENRGPSAARNLGAVHARGEVLFFLDADVALAPDSVAAAVAELRASPRLGAICGVLQPESLQSRTLVAQYRALQMYHWWLAREGPMTGLHTALCAMWARVFREVGPFDPALRHTEAPEYGRRLNERYDVRSTAAIAGVHDHDATLRKLLPKVFQRARASAVEWRGSEVPGGAATRVLSSGLVLAAALVMPLTTLAGGFAAAAAALLVVAALGLDAGTHRRVLATRGVRFGLGFAAVHLLYQLTSATGAAVGTGQRLLGRRGWRVALALLPIVTATVLLLCLRWVGGRTGVSVLPGGDLDVYRHALRATLAGAPLYEATRDGYGFAYPPFAAFVLVPLGWLGHAAAYWWLTVLSMACVQGSVWLLLGSVGVADPGRRRRLALAATLAVLPLSPVLGTLSLGNVNLVLMFLVLADLLWTPRRYRGILLGVAAGIKLTPLIFLPYLFLTGRVRAGVTALVAFGGTVGLGFLLLPGDSLSYWGAALLDGSRTTPAGEEAFGNSLRGVWSSLLPDAVAGGWLLVGLVVAVLGTVVAVRASRAGHELAGIVACALTGLLVSPITWYAHWVWCVPVLVLIAARMRGDGRPRRSLIGGLWLIFSLPLPWWVVYRAGIVEAPMRAWLGPMELLYCLTGIALLALTAAWHRRAEPSAPTADATAAATAGAPAGAAR